MAAPAAHRLCFHIAPAPWGMRSIAVSWVQLGGGRLVPTQGTTGGLPELELPGLHNVSGSRRWPRKGRHPWEPMPVRPHSTGPLSGASEAPLARHLEAVHLCIGLHLCETGSSSSAGENPSLASHLEVAHLHVGLHLCKTGASSGAGEDSPPPPCWKLR